MSISVATPLTDNFCHFIDVTAEVVLMVAVRTMLPPRRTVEPPDKIITGGAARQKIYVLCSDRLEVEANYYNRIFIVVLRQEICA